MSGDRTSSSAFILSFGSTSAAKNPSTALKCSSNSHSSSNPRSNRRRVFWFAGSSRTGALQTGLGRLSGRLRNHTRRVGPGKTEFMVVNAANATGNTNASSDSSAPAVLSRNGSSTSRLSAPKHLTPSVDTAAVHAGERPEERQRFTDVVVTPVVHSAMYWFKDSQECIEYNEGKYRSFEYGRYGNPTTRTAEMKMKELEHAEDCLLSTSGMNSVTTMLLALMEPGGHLITTTDCYRRTRQFVQTVLNKMNVTATVIDPSDIETLEKTLENRGKNGVTLFFSETPTNPYLRCIDIERVSRICHQYGTKVVIDSTFATPVNQNALDLGADLVLHSGTKFLAGHNDVMCGALAGSTEIIGQVRALHGVLGGVLDPHAAYLLIRGMKTLHLRVERQNTTAMALARFLEDHPKVAKVHYPGLPSHQDYDIAVKQMTKGYGGVVSFEIDGDLYRTMKCIDNMRIPYLAPSLGGVESLVEQPTVMSYWDTPAEKRAELGIKDNLVRYSCGIEDPEDLIADVSNALDAI
eukprot:CAMPEP_0184648216 /NCGR_PEP_ID=MMETSP0308-20130426/5284_1 /TAXON_ID=38269 /ORGANISM="Gloeochaete witrockiana, Strain SAG 46.84" /LENGTH=521 /DNA_ID=CAMNT_0027079861 /DNA_START=104 /DNA_END=1669 /DNA_ORIENTATION=-